MIALPNYDTWKTNPKTYEIEYRAEATLAIVIKLDTDGAIAVSDVPRSMDEYYQLIEDDMQRQAHEFIDALNRKLEDNGIRNYGARADLDEVEEVNVLEHCGDWA